MGWSVAVDSIAWYYHEGTFTKKMACEGAGCGGLSCSSFFVKYSTRIENCPVQLYSMICFFNSNSQLIANQYIMVSWTQHIITLGQRL